MRVVFNEKVLVLEVHVVVVPSADSVLRLILLRLWSSLSVLLALSKWTFEA